MWRFSAILMLLAITAQPCVVSFPRQLWSKKPGSGSRLFAFERNGRVGFIDPTGEIVISPSISARIEDVGDFFEGRARVGHAGYIDEAGEWVIAREFWSSEDFSDGLAQVKIDDPEHEYERIGLIVDRFGKIVGRAPTRDAGEFSEGLASFEAKGKTGILKFEPGNFFYRGYPGLKGFMDRKGQVAIKPQFAEVGPFKGGLARAVLDGYCHIVTPEGYWQGSPTSGYPSSCGGAPPDAVSVCKVGFIKSGGEFAIQPDFDSAQDFSEGLAAVAIGEVWGFIDKKGRLAIAPRFERVQSFREGLAAVRLNGKWGFINPSGTLIIPADFDEVQSFSDSLAIATTNGSSVYIDRNGRTKIAGPFRELTPFVNGLAAVLLDETHVAYIDHTGKKVFDYFRRSER